MPLTVLDHVNVRTARLGEMTAFYAEVLGLRPGVRPPFSFGGAWLYCDGRAAIHLVGVADERTRDTGPLDHIAFEARDYDGARDKLSQRGLKFKTREFPEFELRQIFVDDPNGVTVELN